jgi:hypothetical protein
MWRLSTYAWVAAAFAALSALLYFIHYTIFRDTYHIFIFMLGDLAFLPLEVFLVVIVIERLLARREKLTIRRKMNMVVGAFFSELGTRLLRDLLGCFHQPGEIRDELAVSDDWEHAHFQRAMAFIGDLEHKPECRLLDLDELKNLLVSKRQFLLSLLENPNMLEHERFTDLLWAAFHLTEELEARPSLSNLPDSDFAHISADIERLYRALAVEWVSYAEHLKTDYPYLFSLMTRMHPFAERPSPVVTE